MKKIGSILLAIAALSLLGALFSAGRDADTAGGRFIGALILGSIGVLLLWVSNKKESSNQESSNRSSTLRYASFQDENFWQRYKRLNPTKASAIETIIERKMSLLSEKDAREIVSSMERWAMNIGCQIQDIKTEFLQSYQSTFDHADTKEILEHLKNVKLKEEANRFDISEQNTCTHFMIKWLTEDLQRDSPQSANNQMKSRNKMSARDLVKSENASLQFVENPNTGKIFFVCGSKKGYVSPAAVEKMETGSLDDFCYAEVSISSSDYVPCLMLVNKPNVVRSFDIEPDHSVRGKAKNDYTGEDILRKELEIRHRLYILMKDFIQTEYGELREFQELNDLTIPIANAKSCYKDNESMIDTCKQYGLDYSNILDEATSQIVEEYLSLKNMQNDDLPF